MPRRRVIGETVTQGGKTEKERREEYLKGEERKQEQRNHGEISPENLKEIREKFQQGEREGMRCVKKNGILITTYPLIPEVENAGKKYFERIYRFHPQEE